MDPTENARREMVAEINVQEGSREYLEAKYGQVWDTQQLGQDFDVIGFLAPFITARRKSDGKEVSLMFQHNPRFYFSVQEDISVRRRYPNG